MRRNPTRNQAPVLGEEGGTWLDSLQVAPQTGFWPKYDDVPVREQISGQSAAAPSTIVAAALGSIRLKGLASEFGAKE